MNPPKKDFNTRIEKAREMYRKGMSVSVINFEINMSTARWKAHLTDEDKQQHDQHNKNNRRIYQSFLINGRL